MESQDKAEEVGAFFDLELVKPASCEPSTDLVEPLTHDERDIVSKLREILADACANSQLAFVYRGENKNKSKKIYGTHEWNCELLERLFCVGSKAKVYTDEIDASVGQNRGYLQSVNDVSSETFHFIFDQISSILNQKQSHKVVLRFVQESSNDQFVQFFQAPSNLGKFLAVLEQGISPNELEKIRDYYLYLLHTFGRKGANNRSFLVSTSRKRDVARDFTNDRGIIIVYLVPEPVEEDGISRETIANFKKRYKHTPLPLYSDNFFPEQDEVAIKGALFPQFILGIEDIGKKYFLVNPHLFRQLNQSSLGYVPICGLRIDQTRFEDVLVNTSYRGFVSRRLTSRYSDSFFV
ncbi:MAG: hypothetical protein KJ063_25325 [Anaerolineae bacterium]|nr:hypothetical protein [Anaerolineae bacterium]